MKIKTKIIKVLFRFSNSKQTEYAEFKGITKQLAYRKIKNGTFNMEELVQLAEFTNTNLAFVDKKGKPVVIFDKGDFTE